MLQLFYPTVLDCLKEKKSNLKGSREDPGGLENVSRGFQEVPVAFKNVSGSSQEHRRQLRGGKHGYAPQYLTIFNDFSNFPYKKSEKPGFAPPPNNLTKLARLLRRLQGVPRILTGVSECLRGLSWGLKGFQGTSRGSKRCVREYQKVTGAFNRSGRAPVCFS